MTYWLDVFTPKTWEEFKKAGAAVSGFPDRRWKTVEKIQIGDILVCYMKSYSCWFGAFKVVSLAFRDYRTKIWSDASYPCRVRVEPMIVLDPQKAIAAKEVMHQLTLFAKVRDPKRWSWPLRASPRQLPKEDGDLIMSKLRTLAEKVTTPRQLAKEDGDLLMSRPRTLGEKVTTLEERRDEKVRQSYHDQIRDMLYEIGQMERKISEKEYHINGERIDVVWKRIEGGNPYAVFEVQIGGNFYEALAKLKHAWDKWNSRPFLVTTEQFKAKALAWIKGSFHEVEKEMTIVDCEKVKELYNAVKKAKDIKTDLGIS